MPGVLESQCLVFVPSPYPLTPLDLQLLGGEFGVTR